MRFFALAAIVTAKLSTSFYKDDKKAPTSKAVIKKHEPSEDESWEESSDELEEVREKEPQRDKNGDFMWEESNGTERHEKYHCEGLTNSFYRMSLKLRRQGDVPLAEKMLLPFQALHLSNPPACWWEGTVDRWYYGCTDMQYALLSGVIDDMKEHIAKDYLPNDQVSLASNDLFTSADHCIKSFTKDIHDLTDDRLLEMLDADDLMVLGEEDVLFI